MMMSKNPNLALFCDKIRIYCTTKQMVLLTNLTNPEIFLQVVSKCIYLFLQSQISVTDALLMHELWHVSWGRLKQFDTRHY